MKRCRIPFTGRMPGQASVRYNLHQTGDSVMFLLYESYALKYISGPGCGFLSDTRTPGRFLSFFPHLWIPTGTALIATCDLCPTSRAGSPTSWNLDFGAVIMLKLVIGCFLRHSHFHYLFLCRHNTCLQLTLLLYITKIFRASIKSVNYILFYEDYS